MVQSGLADKNLSPQVTRLANWHSAWLLTLKRDHDGAIAAMNKAIAPHPIMPSPSLMQEVSSYMPVSPKRRWS
ncbi:hypothetical protein JOH52_006556 [Sinorhizobium meliloti]|uniref:Uncharacterized protein n=1 Tax=Sinorhizobium meliloti (strain SM11) TaxID=707241 RepID=F7XCU8_SINMM|nr:hypothetical protein SM11_pC1650 [Sinorhizobium meliloti SM11]ARS67427.1 hypothetical protein SMRU11_09755 [Sinorhizobium meliloti RU11/001]ASP67483.1 hypothetical protein CDO29_23985 [Sinorhizobium meliloti]MBP2470464.1 hypothetical protein [Sinorhizobium meliloti]GEC38021.1 hypothetical protein EME01_20930 [Sinorhizobium meliloti]